MPHDMRRAVLIRLRYRDEVIALSNSVRERHACARTGCSTDSMGRSVDDSAQPRVREIDSAHRAQRSHTQLIVSVPNKRLNI